MSNTDNMSDLFSNIDIVELLREQSFKRDFPDSLYKKVVHPTLKSFYYKKISKPAPQIKLSDNEILKDVSEDSSESLKHIEYVKEKGPSILQKLETVNKSSKGTQNSPVNSLITMFEVVFKDSVYENKSKESEIISERSNDFKSLKKMFEQLITQSQ